MPLSKEFYLEEIKSKYPNSYNESLKDLEVKELEDMLDFLEGALDKADGGSIGIEVLFKEKMKDGGRAGFFMGGPALEGQALAIYNSMNASGATDQAIADRLESLGLYTPGATTETTSPNIIGSQINQVRDTGATRPTSEIVADFQETVEDRQKKLNKPNPLFNFLGAIAPQQRSVAEMLASGQIDQRRTSGLPLGIGAIIGSMLPDKYYDMSLADQITTQAYMGFTDPNTNMPNKDPFGLNVRSAFGNYAEKAAEIVDALTAKGTVNGVFDINNLSNYDKSRFNHYKNVTATKQAAITDLGLINLAKQQAEEKRQRDIQEAATRRTFSLSDLQDKSPNEQGQDYGAARARTASRFDSKTGKTKAYGLKDGGVATMFKKKR